MVEEEIKNILKDTASGLEISGVEQIPELDQHECREEHSQLITGEMRLCVGRERSAEKLSDDIPMEKVSYGTDVHSPEKLPKKSQKGEEEYSRKDYALSHPTVDDVALLASWLIVHHLAVRRDRRQGHRRECVHNKVNPKHLRDGQRGVQSDERS